jgi:hypothetical protein
MKRTNLVIATLAATFSGISFTAETPNYDKLPKFPIDVQQHCSRHNTQDCQELAVLITAAQEYHDEHGVAGYNPRITELLQAINKDMHKEGIVTIKEDADSTASDIEAALLNASKNDSHELAEKLGIEPQE